MGKWKATLPKAAPEPGKAHVVLAFKTEFGRRFEYTGQISRELADKIMGEVCAYRPTDQGAAGQNSGPS